MRLIHTLVWHCTATPEGKVSQGRSEDEVGAHVAGHNVGSIGYMSSPQDRLNKRLMASATNTGRFASRSFTAAQAGEIKQKLMAGVTCAALAKEYKSSWQNIVNIKQGRTYYLC